MGWMTGGEGGIGAGALRGTGIETDIEVETETGIGIEGKEVREAEGWTRPNPLPSFPEKRTLFQSQFNVPSGKVNASPSLCR